MPDLVLGPLLRYANEDAATIWVETDAPCEVEILDSRARTFEVRGHHFALVILEGLAPATPTPYEVRLDGRRCWPPEGSGLPPSTINTTARGGPVRAVFGSCRVTLPHDPPYTLAREEDDRGRGHDALRALALRMKDEPPETWPHKILMLGDQVYVDEGAPAVRERIRQTRDPEQPPGLEVADFEEYTWLYHEGWGEPVIRWLLSTVASGMIWDDHDMHDDWNISASWVRDMRAQPWWADRVVGGIASYWVYQHIGNLSPEELREDALFCRVQEAEGDCWPLLREFARRADNEAEGTRWSWSRDMGDVRVVCLDSRAGRVLDDTRHSDGDAHEHGRAMIDDEEWRWVEERARGDVEHLVIATSLPLLLVQGLHWIEAWNEAVCDGAWGRGGAWVGERLRRAGDLESWAAFQDSFHRVCGLIEAVAAGERGRPPATITVISGDVHHAYLAEVALRRDARASSRVWQAVCSPFRNELGPSDRRILEFGASRAGWLLARALAKAAGVEEPDVRWRVRGGPWFDNQMATLAYDGPDATLRIDKTVHGDPRPDLVCVWESRL